MRNWILTAIGFILLGLGGVGVFVPVWPTTPFVLLAAGCFSGNTRLTQWLRQHRVFREYIDAYASGMGVSHATRNWSIAFLWTGLITSMLIVRKVWLTVLLLCIGTAVTIHILWIARKRR